ncbi:MAG: 4Fe-4S dicluster domain-containing protein [Acidobacteria bacterium]|nr:MAG: 4Fe-4S dicluster domain-containing protein [Acidobacteriota bacterium]
MTEWVNITIDGKSYSAPRGRYLLEVCEELGIYVPNFCYYYKLPPQAACRMCLVRIENIRKLQTACTVRVQDGMVVTTNSDEIIQARQGMVDFILANHPLDCPMCDKGGECELQYMSLTYGNLFGRYMETKEHRDEYQLSPFIWLDPQRCILCYRCIRVCDEWVGDHALGVLGRGAHSEIIGNKRDGTLECENCGNCVEVCPVGALTSANFRFRARPWDIEDTITTCTYCADGCQLKLSVRDGKVVRAWAKDMTGINMEFLCLKGRYGNEFVNSPDRMHAPLVRRDGRLEPASWDEAIGLVASRLKEITATHGAESIACLGSPRLTNEVLYVLNKFARDVIGTPWISHIAEHDWRPFFNMLTAPLATQNDIRSGKKTLLLIGGNPPEYNPLTAYSLRYAVRENGSRLIIVNARPLGRLPEESEFFHIRPGSEPALLLALLDESSLNAVADVTNLSVEQLGALRRALEESEDLVVVIGPEVSGAALEAAGALGARWATERRRVRLLPLMRFNNSLGALDMGLTGDLPAPEDIGAHIKALYLVGVDPIRTYGDRWREALARAEFIVVHELFMTETAEYAHVVLPAMSFAEIDGTFTNNAGQVQRVRRALESGGERRPDWVILRLVAKGMGVEMDVRGSAMAMLKDMAERVPGYEGITYEQIDAEGAVQTHRALVKEVPWDDLLDRLKAQVAALDRDRDMITEPPALGAGLFERGTLIEHVPLMARAFGWNGSRLKDEP